MCLGCWVWAMSQRVPCTMLSMLWAMTDLLGMNTMIIHDHLQSSMIYVRSKWYHAVPRLQVFQPGTAHLRITSQVIKPKYMVSTHFVSSEIQFESLWSSWVVSCPLTREATKPAMKPSFDDFCNGCARWVRRKNGVFHDCFLPTKGAS